MYIIYFVKSPLSQDWMKKISYRISLYLGDEHTLNYRPLPYNFSDINPSKPLNQARETHRQSQYHRHLFKQKQLHSNCRHVKRC